MTIKLYEKDGTSFIGNLDNMIECFVTEERNGQFELSGLYPNEYPFSDKLIEGNIIICKANDDLLDQKFRIYETIKDMSNEITINARHISFDLMYDIVENISIQNQSCAYCLNEIFRQSNFSKHYQGASDIVNVQNYNMQIANCLEAIAGKEGSILDTFGTGAEILRDNTRISVLNRRGFDRDVHITYSVNMTDINIDEDRTDMITRIYAYARAKDSNDRETIITAPNKFVDSPRVNNYDHPYIRAIDFTDKFEQDEQPTSDRIQYFAEKYFIDNTVDIPKITYKLGFIPLSKTTQGGPNDTIKLCDTVYIDDDRYNVQTQSKVIKTVFDVLLDRYESMELGQPRSTLGSLIGQGGQEGPAGPPGPQGPPGQDGSIGDFPDTLPIIPQITLTLLGLSSIMVDWTYENQPYFKYQLYASKIPNFEPTAFDLIFEGQSSSYMFNVMPNETWYFRVRAGNTHNKWTDFSNEISINTAKVDANTFIKEATIGNALIKDLSADKINAGKLFGQYIDARNLSVTDGNGKRTFNIDSFGRVYMDVTSLQISSKNVALQETVDGKISKGQAIADINVTPGSVKIAANKIDIAGTTTIGSSTTGRYVEIQNETFRVMNRGTPCMHLGYRTWQGYDGIPQFLMGPYGFIYSDVPGAPYESTYFGMITYGYDKNPENTNPYHSIYYRSRTRAQETQLNFYEDGRTKLNSMGGFSLIADGNTYIQASRDLGFQLDNGFTSNANSTVNGNLTIDKNIITNGQIYTRDLKQGFGIEQYVGQDAFMLRKMTVNPMDLGYDTPQARFRTIYASNGVINTSDMRLKKNIKPIQDKNIVPYNFNVLPKVESEEVLIKDNYYEFVKNMPFYTYDYISEDDSNRSLHNVGFIAQDLCDDPVGKEFIFKDKADMYQYNEKSYVGVLGVALQKAIQEIENLKEEISNLKNNR